MKYHRATAVLITGALFTLASCGSEKKETAHAVASPMAGELLTVHSAPMKTAVDASGSARPFAEATLSTKLMGTVTAVHVREGDMVRAGQVLVSIDARDLMAKGAQVAAGVAEAEAVRREAATHAKRMRALFSEDAASKAQLDAAETALARAEAAVTSARAGAAELSAIRDYSVVRAPFAGVVTRRMVDPGAFAAPGAPLVTLQDSRRLRLVVTAAPDAARGIARGSKVAAIVEGISVTATVEGVVPTGGNLYTINALVDNSDGRFLSGSAVKVALPLGERHAIMIPARAVIRRADLTGVTVSDGKTSQLRWVRLGRPAGDQVEVVAGLREGEQIIVPATLAEAR